MPPRLVLSDSESIYKLLGAIILLNSAVKIGNLKVSFSCCWCWVHTWSCNMLFVHLSRTAGSQRTEFVSHSSLLQHRVSYLILRHCCWMPGELRHTRGLKKKKSSIKDQGKNSFMGFLFQIKLLKASFPNFFHSSFGSSPKCWVWNPKLCQFVPTSVPGWIQAAEITTLKSREALGPLPRSSRAPLPCGSSLPCQTPTPVYSTQPSLGKYNLWYKHNRIWVSCEDC